MALYDEYFPEDPIKPRALPMLRQALAAITGGGQAEPSEPPDDR